MNFPSRILSVGVMFGAALGAFACVSEPREYSDVLDASLSEGNADAAATTTVNILVPESDASGLLTPDGALPLGDGAVADAAVAACDDSSDCDDGNPCNGAETCEGGACISAEAVEDGTDCSAQDDARVCVLGNCIASRCGDGLDDPSGNEDCDDANEVTNDGCEADCTFSCQADADCEAGPFCLGTPKCEESLHLCIAGTPQDDLTECGDGMVCVSATCVLEGCGNGELETGEECDDGNMVLNDGCNSCVFTCHEDAECDNLDVCDGAETCDSELHVCLAGESLVCDDESDCTVDSCNATYGCVTAPVDEDGDGHSPTTGGCGDDCDDGDETVFTGAPELCDEKDNNCDEQEDETALQWYKDCDGDGYAVIGSSAVTGCDEPAAPTDCDVGLAARWTTRVPSSAGESDCWDKDPNVHPRTSDENDQAWSASDISGRSVGEDYDYNCYMGNEPRYTTTGITSGSSCSKLILVEPVLQATGQLSAASDAVDWFATPAYNISQIPSIIVAPVLCFGSVGWTGNSVPGCGNGASYSTCSGATGSCVRSSSTVTQQCR